MRAGTDGLGAIDPRRRRASLEVLERPGRRRRDRPAAGVRPAGAAGERGQPADLGGRRRRSRVGRRPLTRWASSSGSTSRPPRRRPSSSTRRGPSAGSASRNTGSTSRGRCGASRTPGCGGTARVDAIRRSWRDRRPGDRHRRGRADRPDARPRPARRRGRGPPAGDPVERPADRRRMRCHPGGGRARAADRDHRQRRADRVHRAEARLGPRPRAGRLATRRARAPAQGLPPPPAHRRPRDGQGRRRGDASCSTLRRATGRPRSSRRSGSTRRGCRRPSRVPRSPARSAPRPRPRPACARARRSSPAVATRRPTRSGSGWSRPARWRCRWGRRASSSRRPTGRSTSRAAGSTRSATRCPVAGT